jgi:CubicO group peptidase (beta-lactamase class C family)
MNPQTQDNLRFSGISELLDSLEAQELVTAASAVIASPTAILYRKSVGKAAMTAETRYDLASVTKPFTATVAASLDQVGRFTLDRTLGSVWGTSLGPLQQVSMADLLRHEAGFSSWAPLYELCVDESEVAPCLLRGNLLGAPSGTYSDLGYILWGLTAERALGSRLPEIYAETLGKLSPSSTLGPASISSLPIQTCVLDTDVEQSLATELGLTIDRLGAPRAGEVQDGNARFLGGFSAHAGIFGTPLDLVELGRSWLIAANFPRSATVEIALSGQGPYGIGWARRDSSRSAGEALSELSFGHAGFTGCSVFVDPEVERVLVLAAHRVSTTVDLSPWRCAFHRIALRE